jgi:hypothetical protein
MPCPFQPLRLVHPKNIWWRVQIMKFIMRFSETSCYFLRFKYSFSILFSNTVCLHSSHNVRDQVSHLYETIHKISWGEPSEVWARTVGLHSRELSSNTNHNVIKFEVFTVVKIQTHILDYGTMLQSGRGLPTSKRNIHSPSSWQMPEDDSTFFQTLVSTYQCCNPEDHTMEIYYDAQFTHVLSILWLNTQHSGLNSIYTYKIRGSFNK